MPITAEMGEIDHGLKALMDRVREVDGDSETRAGFLGTGKGSESHGKYTVAQIASVHEFGTADGRIPARPFVRTSFDANAAKYKTMLARVLKGFIEGKITLYKGLGLIGIQMSADQRAKIATGPHLQPALKPATIAAKGSDRPLIDTGQLANSTTYDVSVGWRGRRRLKGSP